jgi:REP-associated tyrosine transposase
MRYRRSAVAGATYFFTVVTYQRHSLFADAQAVALLDEAIRRVRERRPFVLEAQVVMPDHLHAMWTLPDADCDYPTRWRLIKEGFTRRYVARWGETETDLRRHIRGERTIWQRRYWERLIRNDRDFAAHLDYIHLNPVRHGLTSAPREWPHSTFLAWVAEGAYDVTWGSGEMPPLPAWAGRE